MELTKLCNNFKMKEVADVVPCTGIFRRLGKEKDVVAGGGNGHVGWRWAMVLGKIMVARFLSVSSFPYIVLDVTTCSIALQLHIDEKEQVLSWHERLQIAQDISHGIEYLHDGAVPPMIHQDLKSANILLDHSMRTKVADFGLSKEVVFNSQNSGLKGDCWPLGSLTYGFVLLHTVPVLFEKYKDQVDAFAEKAEVELKKQYVVFNVKVLSKIPKGSLKYKKFA
ncbi:hypothetical protein BUALT_Bualt10G0094800 [Buddleja alternifolia]|uniref:Protein kinase domain-containing protein n=1 Tax=Buddleja alternifolia TaxID=168488 RepID=A0AAV6X3Y3_9LAMI|nr:hypothetical protein BUALT_Bualt10G0094800 [Buddleja alternifolia]